MHNAIEQFRRNLVSVKELDKIYSLVIEKFPLLKDQASEILRAEVVLTVSALDCFIHDLVRHGMIETFRGTRIPSKAFSGFSISIQGLRNIVNSSNPLDQIAFFESEIRKINASDSYQSPQSIEYALQLINIEKVWTKISPHMSMKAEDIKKELSLIINRRNKIAHEADFDSVNRNKYNIDQSITNTILVFIESFCESINKII
jgi:hypothetical protein